MAIAVPEWLATRTGSLKLGSDRATWFVMLREQPLYSLVPTPSQGKIGCVIKQTNNGKRFPSSSSFASEEEAIRGGLEDLRKALGW